MCDVAIDVRLDYGGGVNAMGRVDGDRRASEIKRHVDCESWMGSSVSQFVGKHVAGRKDG